MKNTNIAVINTHNVSAMTFRSAVVGPAGAAAAAAGGAPGEGGSAAGQRLATINMPAIANPQGNHRRTQDLSIVILRLV